MDCIYLNHNGNEYYCHAQPMRPNEAVSWYQPTEEERKEFCGDSARFSLCPRFLAILDTFKTEFDTYQPEFVEP